MYASIFWKGLLLLDGFGGLPYLVLASFLPAVPLGFSGRDWNGAGSGWQNPKAQGASMIGCLLTIPASFVPALLPFPPPQSSAIVFAFLFSHISLPL